jgi:hypothetical protein
MDEHFDSQEQKPYATATWAYYQTVEEIEEEEEEDEEDHLALIDFSPKPYATSAWAYVQEVEEEEVSSLDDSNPEELESWWEALSDTSPKPYAVAAWTYSQVVTEEDDPESADPPEWWETIGGEGPKPYAIEAWTYHQEVSFVLEFVAVSSSLFFTFDEQFYPREDGLGLILDSGYFGQVGEAVYDEAYYLEGERGILMKRKLARVLVFDKLADSPGLFAPEEDRPPGTLLGSVSYELFDTIVTITDWEHLNWQDDTPVRQAVKVILNELPDCVTEVRVLSPPYAFWTALGFVPDFKGDKFLHLYTV